MSPELHHQIRALHQFLIHGIALYGAAASLGTGFPASQNKGRFMIFFTKPSRNDPRKALMAVRKIDNQNSVIFQICGFDQTDGFFFSLFCQCLSALIQGSQVTCQFCRFFYCLCIQKLQRTCSRVQSSAGIDTGSQHKSDMIGGNLCIARISS